MTGTYDAALDLVLADGKSRARLQRGRTPGRQSLHRLGAGSRGEDGKAALALPIHAARHPRLGRPGDASSARCQLAGPATEAADRGESQWVLLRARPDDRPVPDGQTVPEEAQLGERHRLQRTTGSQRPEGGCERRNIRVSGLPGRNQLVLHVCTTLAPGFTISRRSSGATCSASARWNGKRAKDSWAALRDPFPARRSRNRCVRLTFRPERSRGTSSRGEFAHRIGRCPLDGVGPGVLRREQRVVHGGRRSERTGAMGLSNESRLEGLANDLHVRQQAVRRHRRCSEHRGVCVARLTRSGRWSSPRP